MKETLIDTDILSLFLRGNKNVKSKVEEYLKYYPEINISILSYYEILSGLKHRDANKQLESFLKLCESVSTALGVRQVWATHNLCIRQVWATQAPVRLY